MDGSGNTRPVWPSWTLLPGLAVYNLIGRHILAWGARRALAKAGQNLSAVPGRISLADLRPADRAM